MKTLVQNKFHTIYRCYSELSLVILEWTSATNQITDIEYREVLKELLLHISYIKPKNILLDTRKLKYEIPSMTVIWEREWLIPEFEKLKIEKKAILKKNKGINIHINRDRFKARVFTNFSEIVAWYTEKE